MDSQYADVAIIGAGAAGLFCALTAGRRGRSVIVLDHSDRVGSKIRISGGGRCNFSNRNVDADKYLSTNPRFCSSALARFTTSDMTDMLDRHGIRYHERDHGRLFLLKSSSGLIEMLGSECRGTGVRIRLRTSVVRIRKGRLFSVKTDGGIIESASLVVATGGLSYREIGATGFAHRLARQFGLQVTPVKPALVPLIFSHSDLVAIGDLSGISSDAEVECNGKRFRDNILFTHRGLSGPAVLQASLYWNKGDPVTVDLSPNTDLFELIMSRRERRTALYNLLSACMPARLARAWCRRYALSQPVNRYSSREARQIADRFHRWSFAPAGTEGYAKAEVTAGGVDTHELSSKTMEARGLPGLFFIGEAVDVTGQLGGYNLHWAWASGAAAGQYA